jgi:SAM-dependent methyltransferase
MTNLRSQSDIKRQVRDFWDAKPCGVKNSQATPGTREFYDEIEQHRYREEFHIPLIAEFEQHSNERVLEIGGGVGTDGRQYATHGTHYIDADLSLNSLLNARQNFEVHEVTGYFAQADAEKLPFPDDSFDLVYSHGVLHHTPNTLQAINQGYRVLRPGGKIIIMLYARESFGYIAAHIVGRMRLELLRRKLGHHAFNDFVGLPGDYHGWLPLEIVINNSTDGLGNPLSKMYTAAQLRRMFGLFRNIQIQKHYFPRRKIPVLGPRLPRSIALQLGQIMGSFWYIKGIK